ncbi:MAG: hypothetical protein SOS93_01770 [Mannheimia varigena]|nr:hypothetical protein [Mannheimia varigena]
MQLYEYICFDNEPNKEDVLEAISKDKWITFKSYSCCLDLVAQNILMEKHSDWEMYDENDVVYLVVRKFEDDYWELHEVSICYSISTSSKEIYFDD